MEIRHLASGSKGNATLVSDGQSSFLLDAGLTYRELAKKVKLSEVEGVLVSHSHKDHSRAVLQLQRRGIDVYMGWKTAKQVMAEVDTVYYRNYLEQLQQRDIGSWIVLPFEVNHDVANFGYLLQSRETKEKALYMVDSSVIDYSFEGITHWLIEVNYDDKLLEAGPYNDYLKDRVKRSHMSLDNLKVFLKTSDLSKTKEIHLLHLSDCNAHEQQFIDEIQALTGKPTYSAHRLIENNHTSKTKIR